MEGYLTRLKTWTRLTWVIVQCVLLQFEFIDTTETVLAQETLDGLDHIHLLLRKQPYSTEGLQQVQTCMYIMYSLVP